MLFVRPCRAHPPLYSSQPELPPLVPRYAPQFHELRDEFQAAGGGGGGPKTDFRIKAEKDGQSMYLSQRIKSVNLCERFRSEEKTKTGLGLSAPPPPEERRGDRNDCMPSWSRQVSSATGHATSSGRSVRLSGEGKHQVSALVLSAPPPYAKERVRVRDDCMPDEGGHVSITGRHATDSDRSVRLSGEGKPEKQHGQKRDREWQREQAGERGREKEVGRERKGEEGGALERRSYYPPDHYNPAAAIGLPPLANRHPANYHQHPHREGRGGSAAPRAGGDRRWEGGQRHDGSWENTGGGEGRGGRTRVARMDSDNDRRGGAGDSIQCRDDGRGSGGGRGGGGGRDRDGGRGWHLRGRELDAAGRGDDRRDASCRFTMEQPFRVHSEADRDAAHQGQPLREGKRSKTQSPQDAVAPQRLSMHLLPPPLHRLVRPPPPVPLPPLALLPQGEEPPRGEPQPTASGRCAKP
jgi:hypothetical protein